MARMMVQQPNGLYSIFSTICDDYILEDVTIEEVIEALVEEQREKFTIEIKNAQKVLVGPKSRENYPHYPVTTWEDTEGRKAFRNKVDIE